MQSLTTGKKNVSIKSHLAVYGIRAKLESLTRANKALVWNIHCSILSGTTLALLRITRCILELKKNHLFFFKVPNITL